MKQRLFAASFAALFFLSLFLPSAAAAETRVVFNPAPAHDARGAAERIDRAQRLREAVLAPRSAESPRLFERGSGSDIYHFVPYFFVDPATDDTTLFALRNNSELGQFVEIAYRGADGESLRAGGAEDVLLAPRSVYSVNIRDLGDLTPRPDGTYRGYVIVREGGPGSVINGDYFRVDLSENFATGDRMHRLEELCAVMEARFLQGGPIDGGTEMVFIIDEPRGSDPMSDPPSAHVATYAEDGTFLGTNDIYTDDFLVVRSADEFSEGLPFGVFEVDFNGGLGFLTVTYSADGKYSIGLRAACIGFLL